MKTCPHCTTGYPDSLAKCPTHDVLLNEIRDLRPGLVIHKTYRIVRKLGQGGMGTVYLVEHIHMGEQRALKFLSQELSHDQALVSRFLLEARTLRQVHSRNVVECGDLEAAEDDSLFFSMEFVDGPDLRDSINHAPKPFDVHLALTIARGITEGLGAAHAKGMVHRDIKPENILMGRDGDDLVPKIADFGIVATKESSSVYTRTGGTLLTMAYAAPEQWRGMRSAELDGRTDFYALGGVLFEMLTGQTVFEAESYEGWALQHQTITPQPPSSLRPELADWKGLDALVLGLLAKDREKRPKDINHVLQLIDELGSGHIEPIPRVVERAHQAALVEKGLADFRRSPRVAGEVRTLLGHTDSVTSVAFTNDGRLLASGSKDKTVMLWQVDNGLALRTFQDHTDWVRAVAFGPHGRSLASGSDDRTVKLWDLANLADMFSGKMLQSLQGRTKSVLSVAVNPKGDTLAAGSKDGFIKLWDTQSGEEILTLRDHTDWILSVAFSPEGGVLASGSKDNRIKLWEVTSGRLLCTLQGHASWVLSVAFSPDGRALVSGSRDKSVRLWNVASGQAQRTYLGHGEMVESVGFSPDGHTIASGSDDKTIKLWDVASGRLLRTLKGHASWVESVVFSPEGDMVASGSDDHTIKLWDLSGLRE
jgi:serine/threonine protein kinase